jgi:hypothetical protein
MSIFVGQLAAAGSHTVSGMSSQPRLVLFTGTNQSTFGTILTGSGLGGFIGFASNDTFGSTTIKNYCESAIMTGTGCSNLSERCCYAQTTNAAFGGATLYEATVTSFNADGFSISFSTGSGAHTVFYMAFCGIDGSHSFLYEKTIDGTLGVDIGTPPSVAVALSQWRDTGHTMPKSTSTLPWCSGGFGDVSGGSGSLVGEWLYQTYSKNNLTQRWTNGVNQPGSNAILGAENRPGPLQTTIGLGYLEATRAGNSIFVDGEVAGHDYAIAVLSEQCTRMEAGAVQAGTEGATQTFVLDQLGVAPEACVFINMESQPKVASDEPGRWGFGFASPTFECSWLVDRSSSAMYQSTSYSWISSVSATAFSAGTTDFAPTSGQIGFVTVENAGGAGVSGFGAFATFCDIRPWLPQIIRHYGDVNA